MKIKILLGLTLVGIAAIVAGCTIGNPKYNPEQPRSADNAPYIVDTNGLAKFNGTVAKIGTVNDATAPLDPYAPVIKTGLEATTGLVLALSGIVASLRSKLAAHKKAGQTMANLIANGGGNLVALANAPDGKTASIIANHLQDAPNPPVNAAPPPKV